MRLVTASLQYTVLSYAGSSSHSRICFKLDDRKVALPASHSHTVVLSTLRRRPEPCETEAAFNSLIPYSLAQIFDIHNQLVAYLLYNEN